MKKLTAILIGIWLGMQVGFACVASPYLFINDVVSKDTATAIVNSLFYVSNGLGLLAWILAFAMCRGQSHWGARSSNRPRQWIGVMLVLLIVSFVLLNVVSGHETHFLVNVLGGSFGAWRGSLHLLNVLIGLIGLGLALRLLRYDE